MKRSLKRLFLNFNNLPSILTILQHHSCFIFKEQMTPIFHPDSVLIRKVNQELQY
uniref:Uncharacterized protein n=1 Tax=Anguilla anguilla TaxID=7936 RepID=A0A0E9PBM8_ANGAN